MNVSRDASAAGRSPASASRRAMKASIGFGLAAFRRARRRRRGADRLERPVRPVVRAFLDPTPEQRLLGAGQRQVRLGRRHHGRRRRRRGRPAGQLAAIRLARRDDGPPVVERLERAGRQVETQLGFAFAGVGSVATEAAIGQQRTDLGGEVDRRLADGRGLSGEDDDRERRGRHRGADHAPAHHRAILRRASGPVNSRTATFSCGSRCCGHSLTHRLRPQVAARWPRRTLE